MGFMFVRNVVLMILFIGLTKAMAATNSDSATPNTQLPGSKWTVYIFNKMTKGGVLLVHCKSRDDDLGVRRVFMDQGFDFSFKENFWQRTLFWCSFRSKQGCAEFNVFWPERRQRWLQDHCDGGDCVWTAKDDGIYLRNNKINNDDYKHDWNKTSS